jgi:nitrogenase-associated protein
MTTVTFYEKSGCSGNARQKALLAAAGHEVIARDLRHEQWSDQRLLSFFAGLPVADWFNRNAPAVKSGAIVPESFAAAAALALLQQEPLLIRRPLLEVGDTRMVGFDLAAVDAWIGLNPAALALDNVESCRHGDDPAHRCHDPLAP